MFYAGVWIPLNRKYMRESFFASIKSSSLSPSISALSQCGILVFGTRNIIYAVNLYVERIYYNQKGTRNQKGYVEGFQWLCAY